MIRCPKCKNALADDARYCNICGAPQLSHPSPPASSPLPQPTRTIQPVVRRIPMPGNRGNEASVIAKSTTPLPDNDKTLDLKQRKPAEPQGTTSFASNKPVDTPTDILLPTSEEKPAPTAPLSDDRSAKAPGIIRPIVSSSSLRQNKPASPAAEPILPLAQAQPPLAREPKRSEPRTPFPSPPMTPMAPPTTPSAPFRQPEPPTNQLPTPRSQPQARPANGAQSAKSTHNGNGGSNGAYSAYGSYGSNGGTSNGAQSAHGITNGPYSHAQAPASTLSPYEPTRDSYNIAKNGGEHHRQEIPLFSPESLAYTSMAAEHWRKSWRDRQYAEAGPAEDVSKGQASVPAPLLAMQHSFVRMRAIVDWEKQGTHKNTFGFWMTLFIMICLILGMGAYLVYSYLPNVTGSNSNNPQITKFAPSFSLIGTTATTFARGETLHTHGNHFGANDPITFLLDTTTPILSSSGTPLTIRANGQGAFDVAIPITANWPLGVRIIQAVDTHANLSSYLDIQVNAAGKPEKSSPNLSISLNDQPITSLVFTKQIGQPDPPAQRITITNTSDAPLPWAATTQADLNLQWLSINDNNFQGQLDISQPLSIGISVDTTGLTVTPPKKPYTGQVLFTLNGKELLTLPVQLIIINTAPEMVFSPQPIIAIRNADGTCKAGATLTLINLGLSVIHWAANPDQQGLFQFINSQGVVTQSGELQPSGQDEATVVLNLRCFGVQKGHQYHVAIYENSQAFSDTIYIQ